MSPTRRACAWQAPPAAAGAPTHTHTAGRVIRSGTWCMVHVDKPHPLAWGQEPAPRARGFHQGMPGWKAWCLEARVPPSGALCTAHAACSTAVWAARCMRGAAAGHPCSAYMPLPAWGHHQGAPGRSCRLLLLLLRHFQQLVCQPTWSCHAKLSCCQAAEGRRSCHDRGDAATACCTAVVTWCNEALVSAWAHTLSHALQGMLQMQGRQWGAGALHAARAPTAARAGRVRCALLLGAHSSHMGVGTCLWIQGGPP
jgi:hypothetical protein